MEDSSEKGVASFPELNDVSSAMKRESRFFLGIEKSDIQILTGLLEDLNSFLEGADSKSKARLMKESVNCWLEQTKDSKELKGFVSEDCLLKLSNVLREQRVVNFLARAGRSFDKLTAVRSQASETRVSGSCTGIAKPQQWKFFSTLAGRHLDSVSRDLIPLLTEGEPELSAFPVLGPAGIGKTAVAKRVYESEEVKHHFDCRCWIDVSGSYNFKDLRKFVIKNIQAVRTYAGELRGKSLMDLVDILNRSLRSKRFLFVFDNVYQQEFWDLMRRGLPDDLKGSRIVITTMSDEVVNSFRLPGSVNHVLKLDPLSDQMAWELFCEIAFHDDPEMQCPTELKQVSLDVVRLCLGLPLRILRVAGLLSMTPKSVSDWLKVAHNFKCELQTNLSPYCVLGITFSYLDLPDHLRPCFLYFSIFPKDYLIPTYKLLMLWIAEGFIESKRGKSLEEVAEEYLNELVHRDLVQKCQAHYEFRQLCKINVLVHDIARIKADELKFCQIRGDDITGLEGQSHRLLIRDKERVLLDNIDSRIHSLFLFGVNLPQILIRSLMYKCTVLAMLDFEDCPIDHLPEELSELSNLKYLCLKNTKVKKLPKSIQNLKKLQTLDCRNTLITELPEGINKVTNLRHLLASNIENKGVRMKGGLGDLVNLGAIMTVEAYPSIFEELMKLKQLRKLGISGLTSEAADALCTCINKFIHLEALTLEAATIDEVLVLSAISPSLRRLKSVVLKGLLPKLPSWILSLQNLKFLCLSLSQSTHDPVKQLSNLRNLEALLLYGAYEGEELYFEEGGFEKLKILVIRELSGLSVLEIEEDAFPLLEELRIGSSPLLNEVPTGISYLRNLKVFANYDMPKEYVVTMQPNGGSDFWKVEHIAFVVFLYRVQGRDYRFFKLGDSELLDYLLGIVTDRSMIIKHRIEHEFDYCGSDYEEDDDVGQLSFSAASLTDPLDNSKQWSFSSGFYTDDIEE